MSEPLKPCPFCGKQPLVGLRDREVWCPDHLCAGWSVNRCSVAAWNRRTPDPRVEALVKAADRMLDAFCVHDTGEQVASYEATCDALAAFKETTNG